MTQYKFRPFNPIDEEYQTILDINERIFPDQKGSIESLKHRDQINKDKLFERFVCEVDGRIVSSGGYGEAFWSAKPGKYFIFINVDPPYQNRGIGTAFYDKLHGIVTQHDNLRALDAYTREDQPQSVRFLQKRGFEQVMRFPRSKLDVQAFQPEKYAKLVEKLRSEGIEFLNLNRLAKRFNDYRHRLHDAENEIEKDIPSPEPFKQEPFEEFEKRIFAHPNLLPEAFFVAVDGDKVVGVSVLWNNAAEGKWSTGLTGVLRSHRRRGVATALKTHALGYAKSQGIVEVDTDNEENNPMYQINLQLGFKPAPADLDFMKYFDD